MASVWQVNIQVISQLCNNYEEPTNYVQINFCNFLSHVKRTTCLFSFWSAHPFFSCLSLGLGKNSLKLKDRTEAEPPKLSFFQLSILGSVLVFMLFGLWFLTLIHQNTDDPEITPRIPPLPKPASHQPATSAQLNTALKSPYPIIQAAWSISFHILNALVVLLPAPCSCIWLRRRRAAWKRRRRRRLRSRRRQPWQCPRR